MAIYCISDIHGRMDAFHNMLEKIRFSDRDLLYILGDVVDRGPHGIALLREIMAEKNMRMLIGNHELMMLDYYNPHATQLEINRWNRNRNMETKSCFAALSQREKEDLLLFLDTRPNWLELDIKGRLFHLVHGYPGANRHDCVWNRPQNVREPNPIPGKRLVVGHTPVPIVRFPEEGDLNAYFDSMKRTGDHVEVLFAKGFIDIDCGCGHTAPGCCMGCLRLDDLATFYEQTETPAPEDCVDYEI